VTPQSVPRQPTAIPNEVPTVARPRRDAGRPPSRRSIRWSVWP